MGRPEKPVDETGGAVAEFASGLRRLRAKAGNPTYRDMARTAMYSASVLSSAANGHRLPTLQVALGYVEACRGDREEWRRRWMVAAAGGGVPMVGPRAAVSFTEPAAEQRPSAPAPASASALVSVPEQRVPGAGVPAAGMPRPAQLPLRPQGFVGRAAELARLGGPGGSPVLISGRVGVGKSELALRHAYDLADRLVDGQLYADLGPLTKATFNLSELVGGFLSALGVPPERIPAAPDQQAGLFRSLLARRSVLVLLENVHCERQIRPLLADSGTSTTIVVSRTPLLGLRDVRRIRLEPLPRADSVELIARALPERAQADPAGADRLAELCGDLPLALDIATRKLAARPDISLRWAASRLDCPETLLDWLSVGDLSMRESLNSAHVQLGDRAAELLDLLAKRADSELRAEESIPAGADELIDELVDAGMLGAGERQGTYRVDPLVRAFVSDRDPAHNLQPRRELPFPRMRPEPTAGQLSGPADQLTAGAA
ncbi:AfsR family transcriptional regulator [Kitasatospora sp. Root187]|nr:AfsR family transcriptional regulator [Kitasatospora sp. Root107]KRB68243.1 AfsR family transcriptional regulator [Kitasatospora sp. Root187]